MAAAEASLYIQLMVGLSAGLYLETEVRLDERSALDRSPESVGTMSV